jgi:hypothetical protein
MLTLVSDALRYNDSKSFEDFAMLTNEMKRQAFIKLRTENYRASLRLEGLAPRPVGANKPPLTTAQVKTKDVR